MFLVSLLLLLPLVTGLSVNHSISLKFGKRILKRIDFVGFPYQDLDLSNMQIESIQKDEFENFTNLKTLNLQNNLLTTLPEFVFSNLSRLENLSLAQNDIYDIKENVFVGLKNLKSLNLSSNPFSYLKEGSLFGLPKNVNIYVDDNTILFITPKIFEEINILKENDTHVDNYTFHLKYDEYEKREKAIPPLPENISVTYCIKNGKVSSVEIGKNDEHLEENCRIVNNGPFRLASNWLDLHGLGIKDFKTGWFQLSKSIKAIDLSDNLIEEITDNLLSNLPNCKDEIWSSANKIKKLSAAVLQKSHVKILRLRLNLIKNIEEETFENTEITYLDLLGNQLSNLNFVKNLPSNLTDLLFDYNHIQSIPEGIFSHLSNLKTLSLSGNNITRLESDSLRGLHSLETIYLNDNKLSHIAPKSFVPLNKLRSLLLSQNSISTLPKGIFENLEHLEKLDLSSNGITQMTLDFCSELPKTLKELSISENKISFIETVSFKKILKLSLDASGNKITNIKPETLKLSDLEILDLYDNSFTDIKFEYFSGFPELRSLFLQDNSIRNIEKGAFSNNPFLDNLDISYNRLQRLGNGVLYGLPKSAKVIIESNDIKVIQSGVFDKFDE